MIHGMIHGENHPPILAMCVLSIKWYWYTVKVFFYMYHSKTHHSSGWWFQVSNMNFIFHDWYGMSSSNHWRNHIFQDGYCTTHHSFFCWFTLPPLIIFNLPNEGWTNTVLEKNDRLRVSISWGDANIFDFRHCKTQLFLLSSYRYDRNCGIMSGWWFGTMEFYDFPFRWECHHPNWLSPHDFSEG